MITKIQTDRESRRKGEKKKKKNRVATGEGEDRSFLCYPSVRKRSGLLGNTKTKRKTGKTEKKGEKVEGKRSVGKRVSWVKAELNSLHT